MKELENQDEIEINNSEVEVKPHDDIKITNEVSIEQLLRDYNASDFHRMNNPFNEDYVSVFDM